MGTKENADKVDEIKSLSENHINQSQVDKTGMNYGNIPDKLDVQNLGKIDVSKQSLNKQKEMSKSSMGRSSLNLGRVEDDEAAFYKPIRWINIIFLPYHPVFRMAILFASIVKVAVAPVLAVYPFRCVHIFKAHPIISYIQWCEYISNPIYLIHTILHIVHRQVTTEAMKREHMPKSGLKIALDLISVVPLFDLMSEGCPKIKLWPNILSFNEVVVIYQIVDYFSLLTTHSPLQLLVGYTLMFAIFANYVACLILLLTFHGFCRNCGTKLYDWRLYMEPRFPGILEGWKGYLLGYAYAIEILVNELIDEVKPATYMEFLLLIITMTMGYLFIIFILVPKLFGVIMLHMRRMCTFHPRVCRIIEDTRRRNDSEVASAMVEHFYSLSWANRRGITTLPKSIEYLPKYLKISIRQNLCWSVFHHSPILRYTSEPYKRWICEHITLQYRLPGERFFIGAHCYTNLYYLKSGTVRFISSDDSVSPVLSVTSGTIFGDVNFFVPPLCRKVTVRCYTYCEIFMLSRKSILQSLMFFPEERFNIIKSAEQRIKHARTLQAYKKNLGAMDRSEKEGINWLQRRWWEIRDVLTEYKRNATREDSVKCEIPPEEAPYHCAKYIGQLVLCHDAQLHNKSLFSKIKFPWILVPNSAFGVIWNRMIIFTVYVVLFVYPLNLARQNIPLWFEYFQYFVDFLYAADILVSIMTSMEKQENISYTFGALMVEKLKNFRFMLDVASTIWLEDIANLIGLSRYYRLCQFNRMIKIYILFYNDTNFQWHHKIDPLYTIIYLLILLKFVYLYVGCYFIYVLHEFIPNLNTSYIFGHDICPLHIRKNCSQDRNGASVVFLNFMFKQLIANVQPFTREEIVYGTFVCFINFTFSKYLGTRLVTSLYLHYREKTNYHTFVAELKTHYTFYKIHPDLMKRLDQFLTCHWKYFYGMNIMHPHALKDEPYDIYYKFHGASAEKLIGSSLAFAGADKSLIRELAEKARFLIVPRNTTLFLFGVHCKNVSWIANGEVMCEYHDDTGELVKFYTRTGQMLSLSSVFLGNASLRTYTCASECEILYIGYKEFFGIIKRYPAEWSYFNNCKEEFGSDFKALVQGYIKKYKSYQKKLRENIFHLRHSVSITDLPAQMRREAELPVFTLAFMEDPESKFVQNWMLFRMIIVIVGIVVAAIQVGSGAYLLWQLNLIGACCTVVGGLDMALKLFLPYYDHRGLVISDTKKCMLHYLSRGFLIDLVGTLPVVEIIKMILVTKFSDNFYHIVNVFCKFCQVYLVLGYFTYIADVPTKKFVYIMIIKWQIILLIVTICSSAYLASQCVDFRWDDSENLISMSRKNECWLPSFIPMDMKPTALQMHTMVANSFHFAQCGLTGVDLGMITVNSGSYDTAVVFAVLGATFWLVMCYCKTMLVLEYRGQTLFHHGITQLITFLKAERVEKELIAHASDHFNYWFMRTKGLNMHTLMGERIGVIFKEDFNFYFYKKTFVALDTILKGGELLQRQLSSIMERVIFMEGYDIAREMDLVPWVFVVHRGRVLIKRNDKKLAILTKGSIFGILDSSSVRPLRVTAFALENTDVLQMAVNDFHELLSKTVKKNINKCYESTFDYLIMKNIIAENPYNSVEYLMRGHKIIKLPWMLDSVDPVRSIWYYRWLNFVWLWVTAITIMLSLLLNLLPMDARFKLIWILIFLDTIYLVHLITEFYTMQIVVKGKKCVNRYVRWRKFLEFWFYIDIISLVTPIAATIAAVWYLNLTRLLRAHVLCDFYTHFCKYYTMRFTSVLLKFISIILLLHALTCGWIYFACRGYEDNNFPAPTVPMAPYVNQSLDKSEWVLPNERRGGCSRITKDGPSPEGEPMTWFVIAKHWEADYLISLSYIFILHTHFNIDIVVPLNLVQIYYKVFMTILLYLAEMWISSVAISVMYTKYRELYFYDYRVATLLRYFKNSGLSKSLISAVMKYTNLLWRRQKGNWLPEITKQASICLQEDIFSALYLYHLETPSMFRDLPLYFLRQLTVRLDRIVVFPGKYIVQEGDIWPCMYFIHDGDVEKWYTDSDGDNRLVSVLTINGFFGVVPGLFPNEPYQFSYYSRTVVDLVFLRHESWQDLLNGYPDIKAKLYLAARKLKKANQRGKK